MLNDRVSESVTATINAIRRLRVGKKAEHRTLDSFKDDLYFGDESREQMLEELRVRIERFCKRGTREQIQDATLVVQSLLAARGLLPEQASKRSAELQFLRSNDNRREFTGSTHYSGRCGQEVPDTPPKYLRNNQRLLQLIREFEASGKWIFAICHGVQVLAAANLIKGKRFTCYEH